VAPLSYFVREATISFGRGRASTVLAIATIAVALLVLGAFLLVTSSLDRLMAGWSESAGMSVYLRDDLSEEQRAAIELALGGNALVERREFVSKAEAALATSPLPASFELRLRAKSMAPAEVDRLARSTSQMAGVADVRYDRQWLDRLSRVVGALRWLGMALASALAVAAGLTVAAVVRLSMVGRQDEVEIMALVGAPFSAIRGPFILEGVLEGGIGALVALAVLRAAYELVRWRVASDIPGLDPSLIRFLSPLAMLEIAGGGVIVGCIGGFIATRGVR
jgi:cell division transport system permease protein